LPDSILASRFGDAAEARVVMQKKVAGMEGFLLKGGTVAGDEEPVADLATEQLDGAEGGKLPAELPVGGIGDAGEDEPDAIVLRRLGVIAEHAHDTVAHVDGETGKHAAHFRVEGCEGVEDERVWRFRLGPGRAGHAGLTWAPRGEARG
jgi:hypothetical protein